MTICQNIFIKSGETTIYAQIEERNGNYQVQISNERNTILDYYIQENNLNKEFENGKDATKYIIDKYFKKSIQSIETEGEYFVNEEDLKKISGLNTILKR